MNIQKNHRPDNHSFFTVILLLTYFSMACEVPTTLVIKEGSPPSFDVKGSGYLLALRFRGFKKQRNADGEDALLYWVINCKPKSSCRLVGDLDSITYGQVPAGYTQVYPENGAPPPALNESETYTIRLDTMNAPGVVKRFRIHSGKIVELSP